MIERDDFNALDVEVWGVKMWSTEHCMISLGRQIQCICEVRTLHTSYIFLYTGNVNVRESYDTSYDKS